MQSTKNDEPNIPVLGSSPEEPRGADSSIGYSQSAPEPLGLSSEEQPDSADAGPVGPGVRGQAPAAPKPTGVKIKNPIDKTSDDLVAVLRERRHLDDDGHIHVACAVAVSNELQGLPLWMLVIGAPSAGKTVATEALSEVAYQHVDELTVAGLLSFSGQSKKAEPRGLLVRLGDGKSAFVTVQDFSTVLAMSDHGGRDNLFAALRRIYDGEFTRHLGVHQRPLTWYGRLTLLANCTAAIDRYASHSNALGARWLHYRLPALDKPGKRAMQQKAVLETDEQWEERVHTTASAAINRAAVRVHKIAVPEWMNEKLFDLACVTCLGRSSVPRSGYGNREIQGMAETEEPARVTQQLHMLARCLLALRLDEHRVLSLVRKCALDSMPAQRLAVLRVLARATSKEEPLQVSEVARRAVCHRQVARMTLEDYNAIGIADSYTEDFEEREDHDASHSRPRLWYLDGENNDLLVSVLSDS